MFLHRVNESVKQARALRIASGGRVGYDDLRRAFLFAMKITVNGQVMETAEELTVETLLKSLNVRLEYTAIALNREVVKKSEYGGTKLKESDRVEIVHPIGGG